MFKSIVSFVLIAAAGLTAIAQDTGRQAFPFRRDLAPVETIELVETDGALELVISGELTDGCTSEPTVVSEVVGTTLFVDIYRDIPFDMECAAVMTPYEVRVDASTLRDTDDNGAPAVLVVVVNGALRGVDYPIEDGEASPMLNELLVRAPLPYDHVVLRHTPEQDMEITLSGTLSDACPIPVYRAYEDYQNPGFVVVEAYSAINIAAMCLQAITPFEAVMHAPVFDSVAVNGVGIPFNPAISVDRQLFVVQPVAVDGVTAEWVEGILPNIKVTVSLTVDGCEDPVQFEALPRNEDVTTYAFRAVRAMPEQQACTKIARSITEEFYVSPDPANLDGVEIAINDTVVTVDNAE